MVISLTIQTSSPELILLPLCPEAMSAHIPSPCSRESEEREWRRRASIMGW